MSSTLEKIFIIVAGGEFVVGLFGNGFIGVKNCIMWIRKQKLYLVDFILTSLAWARFSQLCFSIFHFRLVLPSQDVQVAMKRTQVLSSLWIVTNHLSTWFATCLAVCYFLKIANFSHPLFLWLKQRTDTTIFVLLLVSVPFLFVTLPLPYSDHLFRSPVLPQYERNVTGLDHGSETIVMIIFTMASLLPFCLSLISFLLLLFSLWRHTKHIELNTGNARDPSLEAHFRAMKNIFFFLFLQHEYNSDKVHVIEVQSCCTLDHSRAHDGSKTVLKSPLV
nr:unnamed protein product [Sorex araneus]